LQKCKRYYSFKFLIVSVVTANLLIIKRNPLFCRIAKQNWATLAAQQQQEFPVVAKILGV
jgi:hypothetical protein